jgi:CelD/BcsL family acetyltransferase involved in cellulose biosynthesis
MYQSGLNPDFDALRPGWLIKGAAIRAAIEQGAAELDFLRGDEPYKASWGARPQPVLEYRLVRRQAGTLLRHWAWLVKHHSKNVARRFLKRRQIVTSEGQS